MVTYATYDEVQQYFKTCSTHRLEKLQMDITALIYDRDDKAILKHLKATHKKTSKKELNPNWKYTDKQA
jgi:hypothetical protein